MVKQVEKIPEVGWTVYVALDLGQSYWELAVWPREQKDPSTYRLKGPEDLKKLRKLKEHLERIRKEHGEEVKICCCYEATWLGYWLHRWLVRSQVKNVVIAPNSIAEGRKGKQAKTDRLDVRKLVRKLKQYLEGDERTFAPVYVPALDEEAIRERQRERETLKKEVHRVSRRLESKVTYYGIPVTLMPKGSAAWKAFVEMMPQRRTYNDDPIPSTVREEMVRLVEQLELFERHLKEVERAIGEYHESLPEHAPARRLEALKGIGVILSEQLCSEMMNWGRFSGRKQPGKYLGLTPTPSQSCSTRREKGIGKDGNASLRRTAIELAWLWHRWQPESALVKKHGEKLKQKGRIRRMAIVALARELIVALWRYLTQGVVPEGSVFKEKSSKKSSAKNRS